MEVRLSDHARQRCLERGVPTKTVKRACRDPEVVYPVWRGRRLIVVGDMGVVVAADQTVVTVIWHPKGGDFNGREGSRFQSAR